MRKRFIISYILIITFFYQCQEPDKGIIYPDEKDIEANDYRDTYCGKFSFTTIDWYRCINSEYSEDSNSYIGSIEKLNDSDSLLLITYKSGRNTRVCSGDSVYGSYIMPRVDSIGKLEYRVKCAVNSGFVGSFMDNDTVKIFISRGGKGCNSGQNIVGVRQ